MKRSSKQHRRVWIFLAGAAVSIVCTISGPAQSGTQAILTTPPLEAGTLSSSSATIESALPADTVKQFEETSFYLKDVDFPTAETGWAVGEPHWDQELKAYAGTILKTIDGGSSWFPQSVGVNNGLAAVEFVDSDTGWTVGEQGIILHTADGGKSWAPQSANSTDDFSGISFSSPSEGWIVGSHTVHNDSLGNYPDDWRGSVWHTTDGGATWNKQILPETTDLLSDVQFIDSQHGWIVGQKYRGLDMYDDPKQDGVVYQTSDGGATWTELYSPGPDITLTSLSWIDADTGWVAGFPTNSSVTDKGFVFHTADGGKTWERQTSTTFGNMLLDIQFVDAQRGYAVGAEYTGAWGPPVLRTMDGGRTWEKIRMALHDSEGLWGIAITGDRVVAVGDYDILVESDRAWEPFTAPSGEYYSIECMNGECLFTQSYLNPHYQFHDVFFTDPANGWAAGSRSFLPSIWGQVILHTANGGETWITQYEQAPTDSTTPNNFRLNGLFFIDSQYGWAVGKEELQHTAILHTSDGGLHWSEQGTELISGFTELFSVQFLDRQNGWALSAQGMPSQNIFLLHTTDGGNRWDWVDTQIPGTIKISSDSVQGEISFVDAEHGWLVGGNGEILSTVDAGSHWTKSSITSCGYDICAFPTFSVAVIDPQTVWVAGSDLFSTTDGGIHWNESPLDFQGFIQSIQFLNSQVGSFVTESGEIWITQDGGQLWTPLNSGTRFALREVFFINPGQGWFVGDGGVILSYKREV